MTNLFPSPFEKCHCDGASEVQLHMFMRIMQRFGQLLALGWGHICLIEQSQGHSYTRHIPAPHVCVSSCGLPSAAAWHAAPWPVHFDCRSRYAAGFLKPDMHNSG